MNKQKAIIIGGSILVLGVVGFIVYKKWKKKKDASFKFPDNAGDMGGSTSSGSSSSSSQVANYNSLGDRAILHNAMSGWGTDESAVMGVAQKLSEAQRKQLAKDWDSNVGNYGGYTLKAWIEGDFSGETEKQLVGMFY